MAIQLTAKENMLLKDQKSAEELCVKKYQTYANQAQDPQLKQLFSSLAQKEQEHLNTINQILSGQVPNIQQGQSGQQMQQQSQIGQQMQQKKAVMQNPQAKESDKTLCQDMLSLEKYVSGTYDTTIFETTNSNVRQVLNHIQRRAATW